MSSAKRGRSAICGASGARQSTYIKRTADKTPDLGALRNSSQLLCEVKTINVSQDEAERSQRVAQGAFVASSTSVHLGEGFLRKLVLTLEHAIEQLDGIDPARETRRVVFVVVHFDDWVGDYQPEYFEQLDEHLLRSPIKGAELVFCPFKNLFDRTFTMRSATVLSE